MENTGRQMARGHRAPGFWSVSVLVITVLPEPSLPAAGIVSTTATFNAFSTLARPIKKSQSHHHRGSGSNGLCRIYDRTTSHRKHHIHLLTTAKLNTFVYLPVNGIGLDTSHFAISHTGFLQGCFTLSSKPLRTTEPPPYTIITFCAPYLRANAPTCTSVFLPKTNSVGL